VDFKRAAKVKISPRPHDIFSDLCNQRLRGREPLFSSEPAQKGKPERRALAEI